jgi:homoserine kinase
VSAATRTAVATAFAPGSIGNVGPGFDVLGLAVDGLGDRVTVELVVGSSRVDRIVGRDAALVPREPDANCAVVAALALLRGRGLSEGVAVSIDKGLPMSGGLGGSAASSVAGAFAAHLAAEALEEARLPPGEGFGGTTRVELASPACEAPAGWFGDQGAGAAAPVTGSSPNAIDLEIMAAALVGEAAVAGRHLDNIGPAVLGGLTLVRSTDPVDVIPLRVAAPWWVALVTPRVRVETRAARQILPAELPRAEWVQQMANTAALVHAFATGDAALLRRSLDDRHAEPRRAALIPHFAEAKAAALAAGAAGCSISGSGPTVFAIAVDQETARRCAAAMTAAFRLIGADAHVGPVARQGARAMAEGVADGG